MWILLCCHLCFNELANAIFGCVQPADIYFLRLKTLLPNPQLQAGQGQYHCSFRPTCLGIFLLCAQQFGSLWERRVKKKRWQQGNAQSSGGSWNFPCILHSALEFIRLLLLKWTVLVWVFWRWSERWKLDWAQCFVSGYLLQGQRWGNTSLIKKKENKKWFFSSSLSLI